MLDFNSNNNHSSKNPTHFIIFVALVIISLVLAKRETIFIDSHNEISEVYIIQETTNPQKEDSWIKGKLISGNWVEGKGIVKKILSLDTKPPRHQRFIIKFSNDEKTLLVSHNIDIAPLITDLQIGDIIHFYGEFQDNEKGGVIHWTHRNNNTPAGFIIHNSIKYE